MQRSLTYGLHLDFGLLWQSKASVWPRFLLQHCWVDKSVKRALQVNWSTPCQAKHLHNLPAAQSSTPPDSLATLFWFAIVFHPGLDDFPSRAGWFSIQGWMIFHPGLVDIPSRAGWSSIQGWMIFHPGLDDFPSRAGWFSTQAKPNETWLGWEDCQHDWGGDKSPLTIYDSIQLLVHRNGLCPRMVGVFSCSKILVASLFVFQNFYTCFNEPEVFIGWYHRTRAVATPSMSSNMTYSFPAIALTHCWRCEGTAKPSLVPWLTWKWVEEAD